MKLKAFIGILIAAMLTFSSCEEKVELVRIQTSFGDIWLYLYDATPVHKNNFLKLAKEGFYNGTTFHRVIHNFMIQGGDPNSRDKDPHNDGEGGPKFSGAPNTYRGAEDTSQYTINAEINPKIIHKRGVIAAARTGDNINPMKRSSGSQFYIVQGRKYTEDELKSYAHMRHLTLDSTQKAIYTTLGGTPHLDGNYTVFGEVVAGMDVIDKIASQKTNPNDRPVQNIPMTVEVFKMKPRQFNKKFGIQMPDLQAK